MKLSLPCELNCSFYLKGKRELLHILSRNVQLLEAFQLVGDRTGIVQRIDKRIFSFKITINPCTQFCVCFERLLIGSEIQGSLVHAKLFDKLVIHKPMLNSDLRSGILGNSTANCVCFYQHILDTSLFEHICAQDPRNTATNNQNFCIEVCFKAFKSWQCGGIHPH